MMRPISGYLQDNGSCDRQLLACQLCPTQLEHVPFRLLQVGEHHVRPLRRIASQWVKNAQGPTRIGLVDEQHVERLVCRPAHQVQQILQVGAVHPERAGAKLPSEIQTRLVECEHQRPSHSCNITLPPHGDTHSYAQTPRRVRPASPSDSVQSHRAIRVTACAALPDGSAGAAAGWLPVPRPAGPWYTMPGASRRLSDCSWIAYVFGPGPHAGRDLQVDRMI